MSDIQRGRMVHVRVDHRRLDMRPLWEETLSFLVLLIILLVVVGLT